MRISPVVSFSNSRIQAVKRPIVPALGYDSVSFTKAKPDTISFGASLLDKITPPSFEDETLNDIIQRNTDIATIDTKNASPRSESSPILFAWLDDDALEIMQKGEAYSEMVKQADDPVFNWVNFEEMDKYFMVSLQRLVDSGVIDDKTFVLIDTGHAIPMAAQLMKEENRAALGNVKGTFFIGENSFPKTHPKVSNESAAEQYEEEIRSTSHHKLASQALTWGDIINDTYKNSKGGAGAVFIGTDIHRVTKFDQTKLPGANELKKLGLSKVVVVQEAPPLSIFSQRDLDRIYYPLTDEKKKSALSYMKQACDEAQKTPVGEKVPEASKEKIKELLTQASDILKQNRSIERSYTRLDSPNKRGIQEQIEKKEFGWGVKMACGSDISEYLRRLKKESQGTLTILSEGAHLLKLRSCPVGSLRPIREQMLIEANRSFERTINGRLDRAFKDA